MYVMKKTFLTLLFMTIIVNCNSPKSVTLDFVKAVGEKNWDAALNQLDTYLQNDNLIERGVKKIDLRLPSQIVVDP
jgi:hypothetical protein